MNPTNIVAKMTRIKEIGISGYRRESGARFARFHDTAYSRCSHEWGLRNTKYVAAEVIATTAGSTKPLTVRFRHHITKSVETVPTSTATPNGALARKATAMRTGIVNVAPRRDL